MTTTVHGACLCGEIQFEADLPSKFMAHCHCLNCQRAHGAAFVTWVGFFDAQFRITHGDEQLARYRTDTDATRSFCKVCGTTLLYQGPRWAGEVHVAAVNLRDPLDRSPQVHVYADRAPTWCPIQDDLPRFGGATGQEPL